MLRIGATLGAGTEDGAFGDFMIGSGTREHFGARKSTQVSNTSCGLLGQDQGNATAHQADEDICSLCGSIIVNKYCNANGLLANWDIKEP